jgi:hypothetical protein
VLANVSKAMAQTTRTGKKSTAQQRQARLAAELRSNLQKRKQQARSRTQREAAGDVAQESDVPDSATGRASGSSLES